MPGAQLDAANHAPSGPLYRQLRPRPHGLGKDEVEQNQRARLCGATIEAVAARGYDATGVAELSRLAGVSKRTFYEQSRSICRTSRPAAPTTTGSSRSTATDAPTAPTARSRPPPTATRSCSPQDCRCLRHPRSRSPRKPRTPLNPPSKNTRRASTRSPGTRGPGTRVSARSRNDLRRRPGPSRAKS